MREERFSFLKELVEAPSPSGYESPARAIWRRGVEGAATTLRTDLHGNTIAAVNPEGTPRIALVGHIDEIGFMVTYIDEDGFISFASIGGNDPVIAPGQRVNIHTSSGTLLGVIGRRPFHVTHGEDREKKIDFKDLWIDVGTKSREAVVARVKIGDPITYAVGVEHLQDGRAASRAFDNKMGAFIAAETLKQVAARGPRAALFAVASVQEEVGLRGAYTSTFSIDPQVGIAIDVTHAFDYPGGVSDKKSRGDVRLGAGPVISRGPSINPVVFDRLVAAAEAAGLPYQVEPNPQSSGTDADAIQRTRGGVATAVISVALRYMHTPVEVLELDDIEQTIDLLAEFVMRVEPDADFTP